MSCHLADRVSGNIGLATAIIFLRRHRRGTLCDDLLQNSGRERGCCPGRHSFRFTIVASVVVVDNAHTATDCLGDVGPVRTCHASWMKSSTSNRTPPPRACVYPGITRTRNLCAFCTSKPVQRTSVSSVRHSTRIRNFCKICTVVPQYPGYRYSIFIPARNLCKFCTPVPQYPELLEVL